MNEVILTGLFALAGGFIGGILVLLPANKANKIELNKHKASFLTTKLNAFQLVNEKLGVEDVQNPENYYNVYLLIEPILFYLPHNLQSAIKSEYNYIDNHINRGEKDYSNYPDILQLEFFKKVKTNVEKELNITYEQLKELLNIAD